MKNKIKELENQLLFCPFCEGRMTITESDDTFPDYDFCCNTKDCILYGGFDYALSEKELPEYIKKFNRRPTN